MPSDNPHKPNDSTPDAPRPPMLSYHQPDRLRLPIGVQAFLGALFTIIVLSGLCIASGLLAANGHTRAVTNLTLLVCFGLTFMLAYLLARRFGLTFERRGWALGIYIGMGLAGLFWGYCGVLLHALSGPH